MGNSRAKQANIMTVVHPKLGEVVPKQRYGRKEIVCTRPVPPTITQSVWQQQLAVISTANRKDFMFLPSSYSFKSVKGFCCTEQSQCQLIYENYQFVWDLQLQNRKLQKKYYQEPELWYMLFNMLEAAKEFEVRGLKVGDIRPKNILLNSLGKLKLISKCSWPGEQSGLEKMASGNDSNCYLACEELKALKFFNGSLPVDVGKSDAFSIGITILEAASLVSGEDLYNWNTLEFLPNKCTETKRFVADRYSVFLVNVIHQLTQEDPALRCTAGEAWATFSPYSANINKLEGFTINNQLSQQALHEYLKKQQKGAL